jgi:hypothetical protein
LVRKECVFMVNIRELQYQKDNPSNRQERVIQYRSWHGYISDLMIANSTSTHSLPDNAGLTTANSNNVHLIGEFYHPILKVGMIHEAWVVKR